MKNSPKYAIALELFTSILNNKYLDLEMEQTQQLWTVCCNLVFSEDYVVELVLGIGGSPDEVSTRFISYLITIFELAYLFYKFAQEGKIRSQPYVRVVSALQASLLINNKYQKELVLKYGQDRVNLIKKFLNFYPAKFVASVYLEDDLSFIYPTPEVVEKNISAIALTDKQKKLKNDYAINKWAHKRIFLKEKNNTILPAEHYAFYHRYIFHDVIDFNINPYDKKPHCVISIGGPAEKVFNYYRKEWVNIPQEENVWRPNSIKLIQTVGKYPPYYLFPQDVTISHFNDEFISPIDRLHQCSHKYFVRDFDVIFSFFNSHLKCSADDYKKFCHAFKNSIL